MLTFLNGKVLQSEGSILGFEEFNGFQLWVEEENQNYAFLQSVEDEGIGFFTVNPFSIFSDYTFELPDAVTEELKVETQEDVAVVAIITLRDTLEESTVNLLAPVIINTQTLIMKQIVLPPNYNFSTRTPLVSSQQQGTNRQSEGETGGNTNAGPNT